MNAAPDSCLLCLCCGDIIKIDMRFYRCGVVHWNREGQINSSHVVGDIQSETDLSCASCWRGLQ